MNVYEIWFLISVFISSVSQIILKTSADIPYKDKLHEYLNIRVIFAYGMFFVSSLITILAYRDVPLSVGTILEATGYVWVVVLGRMILKEHISKKKLMGLGLIIFGIIISV